MARKIDIERIEEQDLATRIVRELREQRKKERVLPQPIPFAEVSKELLKADHIVVVGGRK